MSDPAARPGTIRRPPGPTMTIHERVAAARERLRRASIPPVEADLDARLLAEHVLAWDTTRYFADGTGPEPDGFAGRYTALIERRAGREPIAQITGTQEFWGLTFEVTPDVLIPRPESELIVEVALESRPDRERPIAVADACTGSGCLAVALAAERPRAHVVATDLSDAALAVARRNASRHGVADRIEFRAGDLLQPIDQLVDVIVSNPPYVPARDRQSLAPEVRDHEPALALFAGDNGLDVIKRLAAQAPSRLKGDGVFVFEFGFGQADAVAALIAATDGLALSAIRRDLQGIPRTAVVRRA